MPDAAPHAVACVCRSIFLYFGDNPMRSLVGILCLFLVVCGRGGLEFILPKTVAYLVQVAVIFAFLYAKARHNIRFRVPNDAVFPVLLVIVACSMFWSSMEYGDRVLPFASLFIFTVFIQYLAMRATAADQAASPKLVYSFICCSILLIIYATLQQVEVIPFSEEMDTTIGTVIRPSSLTGSYLHYPLIIGLAFFVSLELARVRGRRNVLLAIVTCLMLVALIASASRSGAVILVVGIFVGLVYTFGFIRLLIFSGVPLFLLFSLALQFAEEESLIGELVVRFMTAAEVDAPGNVERVAVWGQAISEWVEGPVVIGGKFGLYTNMTKNLGGEHYGVVESGFLELLLSTGALGVLLYYTIWCYVFTLIDKRHRWLRAGFIGAMTQTLFYQSIEVLPFVILLSLFPTFSKSINLVASRMKSQSMEKTYA